MFIVLVAPAEAQTRADNQRLEAQAAADGHRMTAEADAEARALQTRAEIEALQAQETAAAAFSTHPALLRLRELETLRELGRNGNARIYIGFEKHADPNGQRPPSD